jgi:Tfp pilus assembly protein PilX
MKNERGAVLIIALIFLLLITAIAASLMTSGSFQTTMVANVQQREAIFRAAESVVQQTLVNNAARDRAVNSPGVIQLVPVAEIRALPANADYNYSATMVSVPGATRMASGYSTGAVVFQTFEIRGSAARNDGRVQTDVVLGALRLTNPPMENGGG